MITELALWMINDKYGSLNPGDFSGIRVWESRFDNYGYLRLYHIFEGQRKESEIINLFYHYMWINCLNRQKLNYSELRQNISGEFKNINLQVCEKFIIKLKSLVLLSKQGYDITNKLISLYNSGDIENLKKNCSCIS